MIRCQFCDSWFETSNEKYHHEIAIHNTYKNTDTNITEEVINKYRTTMGRVKWLLEQYPSTRGDDRIMYLMYLRVFEGHTLVYNETTKTIQFKNKDGVTYEEWLSLTSFETLRRSRQRLQELDSSLQPSDEVILKRRHKEKATRQNIRTIVHSKKEYEEVKKKFNY